MEINDIGGLPAHPLLVHLPVVLVPLATVGALLMLLRPSWRRTFAIPTAVLATLAAVAIQLAMGSGESLEERVRKSDLIETHSRIAEQARPWVFAFALVMIAVVVVEFLGRRAAANDQPGSAGATDDPQLGDGETSATGDGTGAAAGGATVAVASRSAATSRARMAGAVVVLTAVGLGLGAVSTVQVYRTGHSGAKATWHDTKPAESGTTGEDGDGDGD